MYYGIDERINSLNLETLFVVIDEYGNIFGIYDVYEDALDRLEEVCGKTTVAIEEYIKNQDIDHYDDDDGVVVEFPRVLND